MSVRRRFLLLPVAVAAILATGLVSKLVSAAEPASSGESAKRSAPNRGASKARAFVPEKLLRAFKGNREELRHKALDDAERLYLADSRLAPTLWQAIEPALKVPQVTETVLRAVRLYGRLDDPDEATRLVALLSAANPRLVQTAIDLLGERRPEPALEKLVGLKEHPAYKSHYGFRLAVLTAVARYNQPASVGFLVEMVAASDGQLKYEAARELARLTGENFGGKSGDWRTWWETHREGFRVPDVATGATANSPAVKIPWDYDVPQFFGTPVYAKRVVFVIDKSKSMLSSVDGVTRLDDAERELEGAIRKLPDDAWFEIIAYNEFEQPYAGKLVQADPAQKSGAIQFIYSLVAERKTDIYDTLSDALDVDPNLEAILFLSDGEPNVGTIVDCPTIVQRITQQNASQRTSINTIGIDARGAAEEFLKQLAAENFGAYRSIR